VAVTVVVSLGTRPKPAAELAGLVYGTYTLPDESDLPMYKRPVFWAIIVGGVFVVLNIIFW
jgi:SSS family solute:Na+ symporter